MLPMSSSSSSHNTLQRPRGQKLERSQSIIGSLTNLFTGISGFFAVNDSDDPQNFEDSPRKRRLLSPSGQDSELPEDTGRNKRGKGDSILAYPFSYGAGQPSLSLALSTNTVKSSSPRTLSPALSHSNEQPRIMSMDPPSFRSKTLTADSTPVPLRQGSIRDASMGVSRPYLR